MASLLIVSFDAPLARKLQAALAEAGVEGLIADPGRDFATQFGASQHKNAAWLLAGTPPGGWIGAEFPPCPLSLIAPPAAAAMAVTGWWPALLADSSPDLVAALATDAARWQREAALRAELEAACAQLDERKWIERAKGLLMQARGASEGDAFRLLRDASMQANLRLVQVSRSVVEAAAWAEAVNRAGQLRMLSQRLIKLAAQRAAGVELRRAETLQRKAARRVQANLDHLAASAIVQAEPALGEDLQRCAAAWLRLKHGLERSPGALAALDGDAEILLAKAEDLTLALETRGAPRALHIVNLCGRQRMRVQRLAKTGLLAILAGETALDATLQASITGIEAALRELEQAPLSNAEIRAALAEARELWLGLQRGLARAESAAPALAQTSDALLEVFERLTVCYERSLQVILS